MLTALVVILTESFASKNMLRSGIVDRFLISKNHLIFFMATFQSIIILLLIFINYPYGILNLVLLFHLCIVPISGKIRIILFRSIVYAELFGFIVTLFLYGESFGTIVDMSYEYKLTGRFLYQYILLNIIPFLHMMTRLMI